MKTLRRDKQASADEMDKGGNNWCRFSDESETEKIKQVPTVTQPVAFQPQILLKIK